MVPSTKTRGNGHEMKHKRFHLNIRQHFCAVRVMEHWHTLPRDVVDLPLWRSSNAAWTWALDTLLWVPLLGQSA